MASSEPSMTGCGITYRSFLPKGRGMGAPLHGNQQRGADRATALLGLGRRRGARSYLEAFAVVDPTRRFPGIWRFDRNGAFKVVGLDQSEIVKHFYTVFRDGSPDTGIEDILGGIEADFCPARDAIVERQPLEK